MNNPPEQHAQNSALAKDSDEGARDTTSGDAASSEIDKYAVTAERLKTRVVELEKEAQEHQDLVVIQREAKEEKDAFAEKNAEFAKGATPVQEQIEQAMQTETHSARTKKRRISYPEQELSQQACVGDQYEALKALHEDAQRQMETLKEKLEAAASRANSAEMEVVSLKYQVKRLEDPEASGEASPSLPKCCFYYRNEPRKGVTKVFALPQGGAELDAFVADLSEGGDEFCLSNVEAPSKVIPTIVQAFTVRSALVNFRPLSLRYPTTIGPSLDEVWPAAAKRSIRPCPFCVAVLEESNASVPKPHVTDRYHVLNAHTGQQMTVEVSDLCHRAKNVYGEPKEYWARYSRTMSIRILVEDEARCRPELPERLQRQLPLPLQGYPLLEVFGFVSRDDLDTAQLTCKLWRNVVNNDAGTLALRPLQHVTICVDNVFIERAPVSEAVPGALFTTSWSNWISDYNEYAFRPSDFPTIMSLLRHGCALRYESDSYDCSIGTHFSPIAQHLADAFRAKSIMLDGFLGLEEIPTSLQLVGAMGVKDFDLRVLRKDAVTLILDNELLLSAERLHLRIERDVDFGITAADVSDLQERCHEYLRKAVGCHVSFLQCLRFSDAFAVFSCDRIIERFLAAPRSDEFSMPLSIQMEFVDTVSAVAKPAPKPTSCTHPTLRDVVISSKVLPRYYRRLRTYKYDVYHFRNQRTDEWLTVCLGKYREVRIDYVFLQKGRIMTSPEDIDKMQTFPYPLND